MNEETSRSDTENEIKRSKKKIFSEPESPEWDADSEALNIIYQENNLLVRKNTKRQFIDSNKAPQQNRSWCSKWFCGPELCSVDDGELVSVKEETSSSSRNDTQIVLLPQQHPKDKGKKSLILDLDETLIHSSMEYICDANSVFEVYINDKKTKIYVKFRPGMTEFLSYMKELYEIVIFTAATRDYAIRIVSALDPDNKYVSFILNRDDCIYRTNCFVKDLSRLGRKLKDVIIVDNSDYSFQLQPENGYLIKSFYDDDEDLELFNLIPLLTFLSNVYDVRGVSQWLKSFSQEEPIEYTDMEGAKVVFTKENKNHLFNIKWKIQYIDPFKTGINYTPAKFPVLSESTLELGSEKGSTSFHRSMTEKSFLINNIQHQTPKKSKSTFTLTGTSFVENLKMDSPIENLVKPKIIHEVNENFMIINPNDGADEEHGVPLQINVKKSTKD